MTTRRHYTLTANLAVDPVPITGCAGDACVTVVVTKRDAFAAGIAFLATLYIGSRLMRGRHSQLASS